MTSLRILPTGIDRAAAANPPPAAIPPDAVPDAISVAPSLVSAQPGPDRSAGRARSNARRRRRHAQAGLTLIELVVILVIIGVLTALLLPQLIETDTDSKVAPTVGQINFMANKVKLARGATPNYGSAAYTYAYLKQIGALQPTMDSGTACLNPYGGTCVLTGNTATLYVDVDNIPQAQCVPLFTQWTGAVSVRAAATLAGLGAATGYSGTNVTATNAATACAAATNAVRVELR